MFYIFLAIHKCVDSRALFNKSKLVVALIFLKRKVNKPVKNIIYILLKFFYMYKKQSIADYINTILIFTHNDCQGWRCCNQSNFRSSCEFTNNFSARNFSGSLWKNHAVDYLTRLCVVCGALGSHWFELHVHAAAISFLVTKHRYLCVTFSYLLLSL